MSGWGEILRIIERQQAELESERERLVDAARFINRMRNLLAYDIRRAERAMAANLPPERGTYYFLGMTTAYEHCLTITDAWIGGKR